MNQQNNTILLVIFFVMLCSFIFYYYMIYQKTFNKSTTIPETAIRQWTPEFLQSKRAMTDPLADELISLLMSKSGKKQGNCLFQIITNNDAPLPTDTPPELLQYFEKTARLPDWADKDLIALGQKIYMPHGILISLLLSYKSLPQCYACAKGAMVLLQTGRLREQDGSMDAFAKRIAQTAQFVLHVLSPGGLSPDGKGIRAVQRVRLLHAAIRFHLRQKNWDTSQYDEPINQEDMAGTLMSFSALILEGLDMLNITLKDTEKEAYIHCWRIVGYFMGLDDDLLPNNAADASALGHAILNHQMASSEQGKTLMAELLKFQEKNRPPFIDSQTNINLMRFLIGNTISDSLCIPPANHEAVKKLANNIRRIVKFGEKLHRTHPSALMLPRINKIILQVHIKQMLKEPILRFNLSSSLARAWGIFNHL